MKAFYADIKRGERFALLAGPFPSEEVARKYVRPAFRAAAEIDPWVDFDLYGVVAIEGYFKPGKVNHLIEIDPADLLQMEVA